MIARNPRELDPRPISFSVKRNGAKLQLSYQQLFEAGYRLLLAKKYHDSAEVFRLLSQVQDRGPRAHLLLAFCQAQSGDYKSCSQTLSQAFEGDPSNLDTKLHGAFVYWACGLLVDARHEWEVVIRECPQLPTLSLLLGDLLAQAGNRRLPPVLWKMAAQNDRRDGAVGLIARRELQAWKAESN